MSSTVAHQKITRPNAVAVGTIVWLASELMFFAALFAMYFTIRAVGGRGAYFLPESRSQMRPGLPKSQTTSPRAEALSVDELRRLATPKCEALVEADASGRAAWMLCVSPGVEVTLPGYASRGARFNLVCAGTLETEGKTLERLALVHLAPDEEHWKGRAGKDGLQLLVLQFPAVLEEASIPN